MLAVDACVMGGTCKAASEPLSDEAIVVLTAEAMLGGPVSCGHCPLVAATAASLALFAPSRERGGEKCTYCGRAASKCQADPC